MAQPIHRIVLQRIVPEQNMARYYVLSIENSLFGDLTLVREWGKIGSKGRRVISLHSGMHQAQEMLTTWLTRKLKRGYRIAVVEEL